jgi:hypothetical protein
MRRFFTFRISGVREGPNNVNRGWQRFRHMMFWLKQENPEPILRLEARYYKDKVAYQLGMFRFGNDWDKFMEKVEAGKKFVEAPDL